MRDTVLFWQATLPENFNFQKAKVTTTEPKIKNPQICPYMSIYGYIEKQKDLYI
jgi:hypothetical protein